MKTKNCRRFYRDVDKRSRTAMSDYLAKHFRYNTAGGRNHSTSYACNMKVDRLGLDSETVDKLLDLIQTDEFYVRIGSLIQDFNLRHDNRWQAGWNGRSGGYLVLYQGGQRRSQYRSYCKNCGQKNFRAVAESGCRCGVCNRETRVDFEKPPMEVFSYPMRPTDMGEDFEDWSIDELRLRTELVQDFDRLADDIVAEALWVAENYTAVEKVFYVPTTRKVLEAAG